MGGETSILEKTFSELCDLSSNDKMRAADLLVNTILSCKTCPDFSKVPALSSKGVGKYVVKMMKKDSLERKKLQDLTTREFTEKDEQLKKLTKVYEEQTEELELSQTLVDKQSEELTKNTATITQREQELKKLNEIIAEQTDRLNEMTVKIAKKVEDAKKDEVLGSELALKQENDSMNDEIQRLQSENSSIQDAYTTLSEQKALLESNVEEINRYLDIWRKIPFADALITTTYVGEIEVPYPNEKVLDKIR